MKLAGAFYTVFLTFTSSALGVVDASYAKSSSLRGRLSVDDSKPSSASYEEEDERFWYGDGENRYGRWADANNGIDNRWANEHNGRPANRWADADNGVGDRWADANNGRGDQWADANNGRPSNPCADACNGVPPGQCNCYDPYDGEEEYDSQDFVLETSPYDFDSYDEEDELYYEW